MSVKDGSLPPGITQVQTSSFGITGGERASQYKDYYLAKEKGIDSLVLDGASITDAENFVRRLRARPGLDLGEASSLAAVETETHFAANSVLLHHCRFTSLHRLLRTAELTGDIDRRGESLLIGSGDTLPEAAAMMIAPPPEADIVGMVALGPILRPTLFSQLNPLIPSAIPLISGSHAVAVEPDLEQVRLINGDNQYYGFDMESLMVLGATLDAALASSSVPEAFNNILWHRAEPNMAYDGATSRREQVANAKQVLEMLVSRLAKGGSLVLTVGTGGNRQELTAREQLIADAIRLLPRLGMDVKPNYSGMYFGQKNDHKKIFFGDTIFGAIGSVIASKQ